MFRDCRLFQRSGRTMSSAVRLQRRAPASPCSSPGLALEPWLCTILLPGGTSWVSYTLPPMTEP